MEQYHKNALPKDYQLEEYCIKSVLGSGAFGITYKAWDNNLDIFVAIKEYIPSNFALREGKTTVVVKSEEDEDTYHWGLIRFGDESKNLAKFEHPNIVKVRRYFMKNGTAYLVMSYEEGETLKYILEKNKSLTEDEILTIFKPIINGLQAVHDEGLLHRDIKPGNIFLRKNKTAMLIDFGAARYDLSGKSCTLSEILTPGYAPSEQYSSSSKKQGTWSDIYAIGATLHYCITGKPPISANDRAEKNAYGEKDPYIKLSLQKQLCKKYSKSFLQTIDAALEFKIQRRPQTAKEILSLLKTETKKNGGDKNPPGGEETIISPPSQQTKVQNSKKTNKVKFPFLWKIMGVILVFIFSILFFIFITKAFKSYQHTQAEQKLTGELIVIEEKNFKIAKYEVTKSQFSYFIKETGYQTDAEKHNGCYVWLDTNWKKEPQYNWNNTGFIQDDTHPVVCVSFNDALSYTQWLSEKTAKPYRLPTKTEWEYAAKANVVTTYPWGDKIGKNNANCINKDCGDSFKFTAPVGSFNAQNSLHDMLGNVSEWTCSKYQNKGKERCLNDSYAKNTQMSVKGGSWRNISGMVTPSYAAQWLISNRYNDLGFRIAINNPVSAN